MVSLFTADDAPENLLDPGAGIGSLSAAFLERFPKTPVEAWEIDPVLRGYLRETLSQQSLTIFLEDFIEGAAWNLAWGQGTRFSHAILNPPYKKINSDSKHRRLLKGLGIETVNLYSAFLALTVLLVKDRGEIIAIIPRSFCNGTYYKPFRNFLLAKCAISHIHVFTARNKAFQDDQVLQENIVIKLVRGRSQGPVMISESNDASFDDYHEATLPFEQIVKPNDLEKYIHIPSAAAQVTTESPLFKWNMQQLGLDVCTGPVVDFRVRQHCLPNLHEGAVPLLYAHHFSGGQLTYPKAHKKPGAILNNDETRRWLMPSGCYVLTKRFSSKEEKRRVVGYVFDPMQLPSDLLGFENHLNVFHSEKQGLDREIAYGLALFLNSSIVDRHFRVFSGHTQVNATDLRQMKYPPRDTLQRFGRMAMQHSLTQDEVDEIITSSEEDDD